MSLGIYAPVTLGSTQAGKVQISTRAIPAEHNAAFQMNIENDQ